MYLPAVGGQPRGLWIAPTAQPAPAGAALEPALWAWSEVQSGIATLTAPLVEAFVPQMLNYESVGGVSFKKGCYPGQEIVARAHYRGAVKRHLAVVVLHANDKPALGADTDLADGRSAQICNVAANPAREGEYMALVVAGEN